MALTEKMLTLKFLTDHGDCSPRQVAEALDIPEGRAYAHLVSLLLDQDAAKTPARGDVRFRPTQAGEEKVASWRVAHRKPLRMADGG